ncbi:MAG: molybdate ABC transporter substrate-binding protein [Pseudomonadota bacterium]
MGPQTRAVAAWAAALFLSLGPAHAEPVIFAAASTRAALDTALAGSEQSAVVSYGASGTIARQIAQGAAADVFLSANPKWMAYLVDQGLVDPDTIQVLASNRLVLIAPGEAAPVALDGPALSDRLDREYFAVADPEVAPVGAYGKAALTSLGLWDDVSPSLLPTRNTISTVATVARGEAVLGLVYRTDAIGVDGVTISAELPEASHPPIHYLIAPLAQGDDPDAGLAMVSYLTGTGGQSAFESAGFVFPTADAAAEAGS